MILRGYDGCWKVLCGLLGGQISSTTGEKAAKLTESRPDELAKLLEGLSIEAGGERDFGLVAFEPEDEEKEMPIARLPDEVLLHILRMVIQPRGRRGAKVVKPKPTPEEQAAMEAATAALTGKGGPKTSAVNGKPVRPAGAAGAYISASGKGKGALSACRDGSWSSSGSIASSTSAVVGSSVSVLTFACVGAFDEEACAVDELATGIDGLLFDPEVAAGG